MTIIELTRGSLPAQRRWAPIGFRAAERYTNLRSPVLTRETISNRDWKLLETPATQTKQSPPPTSNRDKIAPSSSRDFRRADILPAFLTLPVQMPFETGDKNRGRSFIDACHEFWNCFPTRTLTKIPIGPLLEFTRFEEAQ
jgi:hypothetical protein